MEHNAFNLIAKPNYKMRPLARIKWWFRKRKYIKQRAERGWSDYDAWDFDTYLAMVIGDGLAYLADAHMSHPWDYTPEEWSEKLLYISKCFKQYTEDPDCSAYEAYHNACLTERENGKVTVFGNEDLLEAWREEERKNYEEKMKRLKEGFDLLYEVFPNLWS